MAGLGGACLRRLLVGDAVSKYAVRFAFGAGISLVAALIGMKFGPVVGGIFLGFPAVLPASLTLIEKREGKEEASIDSLGAVLGSVAMVAYAAIVVLTVARWGVVLSLSAALLAWLAIAAGLYFAVARVYRREPSPP
ncbi:MAG: DUF3147 family protein [Chloroflexi bacterium]|nr:MAG: DUF3147 family protein [Chloroflexota bacterium]